jgi:tetratricopeptide (TPR) repeat protein
MEKRPTMFYERFLASGNRYLENNKLDDAERAFASAVRQVYILKNKMYETALALRGLGFVYKARGSIQKSGEDLVKASGLFSASLTRLQESKAENEKRRNVKTDLDSEILQLQDEISNVHTMFVDEILQSQQNVSRSDFKKHEHYKQSLQKIRELRQAKMSTLDDMPLFNPAVRDINVEKQRIEHTQQLYREISKSMKDLITCMVDDCMQIMSSPPCEFSILGLGSTAREEATPYSDLEFCILVETNTDTVQQYFTDFTNLLHLKVVELGETLLPSLGIRSLNNFYSGSREDDWFYDDGPRGFSFDGVMPWASKTPKGRDKTLNKPWIQSLIKTPKEMTDLLTETSIFKEGYHLADVLSTCSLICGDYSLFENYCDFMREYLHETVNNCNSAEVDFESTCHINPMSWKENILQELVEAKKKYHNILEDYVRRPGESYAMKTDIYRFPSLVVQYVGKYFDVQCSSSWETIDRLVSARILPPEGAHNLRTVLGIAVELRLRTYLSNQSQSEHFNARINYSQDLSDDLSLLLQRFFFTVVPLEEAIEKLPSESLLDVMKSELYSDDRKTEARMYLQFRKYKKAENILKDMLVKARDSSLNIAEDQEIAEISKMLGNALFLQENVSEAIKHYKEVLEINERIYQRDPQTSINQNRLGNSLNNYSGALQELGQIEEALSYKSKVLEIKYSLLKEKSTAMDQILYLQDVADAHYNLSLIYITEPNSSGDVLNLTRARHHCLHALDIADMLLEQYNIAYPNHVSSLLVQGRCFFYSGNWEMFVKSFDDALQLLYRRRKYDIFTERERLLLSAYGNLAMEAGDWEKASSIFYRAYAILTRIHGANGHDSLVKTLDNLGTVTLHEGKIGEALMFYNEARFMSLKLHREDGDLTFVRMLCRKIAALQLQLRVIAPNITMPLFF